MKKHYLISLLVAFITLAVGVFSYVEFAKTKKDLDMMIKSEASNLLHSLKHSIENNIQSNEYIQKEMLNALVSSANLANHLSEQNSFSSSSLNKFAKDYELDLILIIDKYGIKSNISNISKNDIPDDINNDISFMQSENYQWLELGRSEIKNELYYLVASQLTDNNSIVICGIKDEKLLDLRLSVGIGTLIKNFSKNEDIEYIVLRDSQGIVAATKHFDKYRISDFDSSKLHKDSIGTNTKLSADSEIMESSILIKQDDETLLLSLGLSLQKVSQIEERTARRTILLAIGFMFLFAGSAAFSFQRGRHIKLLEKHQKTIEYTGMMLSNINDAVVGIDHKSQIVLFNNKAEELFGNNDQTDYNTLFANDLLCLRQSLDTLSSVRYREIEHLVGNNTYNLAFNTSIVFDKKGKPDIAVAIVRDITMIKQAEQTNLRNEKLNATSELAAGVAHEIRNPMNAINIIAQRLELEFEPSADSEEYFSLVATVRREIKRIDNIIAQFINFSKMKASQLEKNDLSGIVDKAIALLRPSAKLKSIEIVNLMSDSLLALADSDKIEQVFINLLQNSIDAMELGGTIEIAARESEETITISIKDMGKGIADSIAPKVFDLYFTSKERGMGLGLGIVNKIILEHNGKIWFDSKIGKGTTFFVELSRFK